MNENFHADRALKNMAANCGKDIPWFVQQNRNNGTWVIVAGGPSLTPRLSSVKRRRSNGGCIVAVNGAANYLLDHGIEPDIVSFLDHDEEVLKFIPDEYGGWVYLLASMVSPNVADAVVGCEALMWHAEIPERKQEQKVILRAHPDKPASLIGGGNTCAMRMLNIGYLLGFRKIHFYGLDSCHAQDGRDHAYSHDGIVEEPEGRVIHRGDNSYVCSLAMIKQAMEFDFYYNQFTKLGCSIIVHGTGLIPDIWQELRHKRAAA